MSESGSVTAALPMQACDQCYSRKVKCDRQLPCTNCVTAKVECQRLRERRIPRPKVRNEDRIQALAQRLSSLEQNLVPNSPPSSASPPQNGYSQPIQTPRFEDPHRVSLKRSREPDPDSPVNHRPSPVTSAPNTSTREAEARTFIQNELSKNAGLSGDRKGVLEAALAFVNQITATGVPTITQENIFDDDDDVPVPDPQPSEIIQMLSRHRDVDPSIVCSLNFPETIPFSAVERVCRGLLNGAVRGQTLLQYKVIFYYKALMSVSHWPTDEASMPLLEHTESVRRHYVSAATAAFKKLSWLATPTLSLLQALMCGATMFHIRGDARLCWTTTGAAANCLIALGYHEITDTGARSDEDVEIRRCIAWCHQMDKAMSMVLSHPQALPKLRVRPSRILHTKRPTTMLDYAKCILELGEMQEAIMGVNDGLHTMNKAKLMEEIARVKESLAQCRASINSGIRASNFTTEWVTLEFVYYSLYTTLLRLNPDVINDHIAREECLFHARKSMESFNTIQEFLSPLKEVVGAMQFYFSWTILMYPLTPFFVLFCNVVCTGHRNDYKLISTVTNGLSSVKNSSQSAAKLYKLCEMLLSMSNPETSEADPPNTSPPVQPPQSASTLPGPNSITYATTPQVQAQSGDVPQPYNTNTSASDPNFPIPAVADFSVPPQNISTMEDYDPTRDLWAEDMIGELFNARLDFDWLYKTIP